MEEHTIAAVMQTDDRTAENLQLIRHLYTCPEEARMDVFLSAMAPDITIRHPESVSLLGGIYQGIAGVTRVYAKWRRVISSHSELLALCGGDEHVIAIRKIRTADEQPYETQITECWQIVNGKITQLSTYYWDSGELGREIRNRFYHGRTPFQPFLC